MLVSLEPAGAFWPLQTRVQQSRSLGNRKPWSGKPVRAGDQGPDELQLVLILAGDGRSDRLRGAFYQDAKQAGHVGGAWYCGPLRHVAGDA